MGRKLKFITCCPDDTYYTWQVHLWLESLRNIGKSEDAIVLLFIPKGRMPNIKWEQIKQLYPEVEFNTYIDSEDEISSKYLHKYIPVLRPYVMYKYFSAHPEMKDNAIFYCDSDILFMDNFNVDAFLDDDINYLSDTNSYINVDYFDNKWRDALPEKQEEFKNMDILSMLGSLIGITREDAVKYKNDSGGAQYLLKNVDANFWFKVLKDCIIINTYLKKVNSDFFESENKGFQSWCADMWAVLWGLWVQSTETKVIPEMKFAWATDSIEKLKECNILHNAGIVSKNMGTFPAFFKGAYHQGLDPMKDTHLETVFNNEESKKYCTWEYTSKLLELKNKYNLNY